MSHLLIGVLLLFIAAGLMFFARPDKFGNHRPFLQFGAAPIVYPPIILVFFAFGVAALLSSVLGAPR